MSKKTHILIVDDNLGLSRSTTLILEHKGYVVTTANNGLEAIEKVTERSFDIIFLDIKMPLMNGVETHRKIKQIRPEAVVMMMTAYSVEDLIQQALMEGAYGVLYKPLDIEKVIAVINKAHEDKKGALIMLVDDDQAICTTLLKILTRKGHQVTIVHNGEEAIAKTRETSLEIIFIDMKLPTINGLETYLAIREINPHIVAVMITGYCQEMNDLVEEALRNDAFTCLYKPIDMQEMLQIIEEIGTQKRLLKSKTRPGESLEDYDG
ncbi:MAG: response regulator [Anaerolineaceae bacterium]|nr:response regulator [Anaerolineaceae bacterium]